MPDDLVRIGEKIISTHKIQRVVEEVLELRKKGHSQQEVARFLELDRGFISRLEGIGEVRRGKRIAVVGFPLQNQEELRRIAEEKGVDFTFILNQDERWQMVKGRNTLDFFDTATRFITQLQAYDRVLLVCSRKWQELAEALLDAEVVFVDLGDSPITEDRYLCPQRFESILDQVIS